MIELPAERVGPYVRALITALTALAPGEDHVPLSAAVSHLAALDPLNGGLVLQPAEVVRRTGMPAFTWLERARAEASVAARTEGHDPDDAELQRADTLDRALGQRMRDRRELHRYLRTAELLASTRLGGAVRWVGPAEAQVGLAYDRIAPDGRWVRLRIELELARGRSDALAVVDGRVQLDDRLRHVLTRHFATALTALRVQLEHLLDVRISRIGRSWLGPFWFPGVDLPAGVPAELGTGLVLHASTEVADRALRESRHLDPLELPSGPAPPAGWHEYRDRRFAAAGPVDALRSWAGSLGMRPLVVPLAPPSRARRL